MIRLACIAAALLPAMAGAATLEALVEERARQAYADAFPPDAVVAVKVKDSVEDEPVLLADFWMDPASGRFLANAVFDAGDMRRLSGLALVTVPVPVAVHRLMPGDIVSENDLRIEQVPVARVGTLAIRDMSDIVGKQVSRLLPEGRAIQAQSIIEPLVIDRGDEVEIRFRDGALALAAPGRALADAHAGQTIRIVNLVSNKIISGTATADGIIEVNP